MQKLCRSNDFFNKQSPFLLLLLWDCLSNPGFPVKETDWQRTATQTTQNHAHY